MAERTWLWTVVAVLIILIAGSGGTYAFYEYERPHNPNSPATVALGSNATVNYIGQFGSGPEAGKIFDTSIYAIASNPAYPKGLEFSLRGSAANYTPLPVYVGASTPSGGYTLGNLSFIGVVTGFWQGLVGMEPNTTRVLVLPPNLAYGATNPACVGTYPLVQTIPVIESFTGVAFQTSYPGITAATGEEFTDPFYGWTDQILNANASFVTVQRLPYIGETSNPKGWPVTVTNVQSTPNGTGLITIRNQLSTADAGHLLGHDKLGTGPCSAQSPNHQFIVTSVNLGAGTFSENFNQEVQNQTLIFTVTVIDYFPR